MSARTMFLLGGTLAAGMAGCGSASPHTQSAVSPASVDVRSAATGDIPDNQAFLTYRDPSGYSIRYPEGWARRGTGPRVAFRDKANAIEIRVVRGGSPTTATVRSELLSLRRTDPTVVPAQPQVVPMGRGRAIKVSYSRRGMPDPVTGKRPRLLVDRYVYSSRGRVATVDLATPKGVDNVDAYRMISRSFRWR